MNAWDVLWYVFLADVVVTTCYVFYILLGLDRVFIYERDRVVDVILYRILSPVRVEIAAALLSLLFDSWVAVSIILGTYAFVEYIVGHSRTSSSPSAIKHSNSYVAETSKRLWRVVLDESDDYLNGFAMGSMYFDTIRRVIPKLAKMHDFSYHDNFNVFNSLYRMFFAAPDDTEYQIPEKYLSEMQGMADATHLDITVFIKAHLMAEKNGGCSTIVAQSDLMGRNLDWMPLDVARETILLYFKQQDMHVLTVPGIMCGPTIWTKTTAGAVNVSPTYNVLNKDGYSMLFHFRSIMETARNKKDVKEMCEIPTNLPLSPYLLTFQGPTGAIRVEFGLPRNVVIHHSMPIVTLNMDQHGCSALNSYYRKDVLANIAPAHDVQSMKKTLKLVQSWITCHSVILTPEDVYIAFGNGYACNRKFEVFKR